MKMQDNGFVKICEKYILLWVMVGKNRGVWALNFG